MTTGLRAWARSAPQPARGRGRPPRGGWGGGGGGGGGGPPPASSSAWSISGAPRSRILSGAQRPRRERGHSRLAKARPARRKRGARRPKAPLPLGRLRATSPPARKAQEALAAILFGQAERVVGLEGEIHLLVLD